jgi:hypothetical protein
VVTTLCYDGRIAPEVEGLNDVSAPGAAVVLWLAAADASRVLAELPPATGIVYLSSSLLGSHAVRPSERLGDRVLLLEPQVPLDELERHAWRSLVWLKAKGLSELPQRVSLNALYSMLLAAEALSHPTARSCRVSTSSNASRPWRRVPSSIRLSRGRVRSRAPLRFGGRLRDAGSAFAPGRPSKGRRMDRTSILKIGAVRLRPGLALIALALLLASAIPSSALQATPAPRQPAASASVATPAAGKAETAAVEALMERAGTVQPGTFAVTGETLTASADELPLVIQADALRGSDKAVRIVVALGSRVTLPAVTRARIVTVARPGAARSVLSEISGTSAAGLVRSVGNAVLQPGEYELQAAVAQRGRRGDVLVSFTRAPLVIPDLWQGGLAVSPIVLADAVAAAPAASAAALSRSDRLRSGRPPPTGSHRHAS